MKRGVKWIAGTVLAGAAAVAVLWALNVRDEPDLAASPAVATTPELISRGAYLARAGNCMACHTTRGGVPFAGGLGIETPFGTVYSSNLTPDAASGIGAWSAAEFWRAMHNGRSKDGRLLYPAFPYPNYTQVTREDSDALFAYLKSLPPSAQPRREHALRWPYGTQPALAVWRALYFSPGVYEPERKKSTEWNRGAYLVQGLGHCSACHTPRNTLGATDEALNLGGGLIPMQNWYAPSLATPAEAGVADWDRQHIVSLLKTGTSERGAVTGPMAEVVLRSTQHLTNADLGAMATFLKELPRVPVPAPSANARPAQAGSPGGKLYALHCAQCHGDEGKGVPGAYPPLAGNRAVTMKATANLVQIVMNGGFAPATSGNPRPYGMPPYALVLSDREVASLLSYIRNAWGNQAADATELEASKYRRSTR